MKFGKMRIRIGLTLVLMFLSGFAQGAWSISYRETTAGERTGEVRIFFSPDGEDGFDSFEGVMDELKKRGEVQRLTKMSLRILKDEKWNARLVEELRKRKPKALEQAPERELSVRWGNPDINALRGELKDSVFALEPFQKVEGKLNELGLMVKEVSTEKFWIDRKDGELRVLGMGLWVSVKPLTYGMDSRADKRRVGLYFKKLFKEEGEWVGVFRVYVPEEEELRVYGRWSAKHQMYVVGKPRLGWLVGDGWKSQVKPVVDENEASFRLSRGTSHEVRIPLGRIERATAVVRMRGPHFSALSEEFVLSEKAKEFTELE